MKNTRINTVVNPFPSGRLGWAFLLLTIFTLSCCKKDDDNPNLPPIQQLPAATQIGANTAGCLVNGEAFLPNNQSLQPLVCNYINGQDFALGISKKVNDISYRIYIYIYRKYGFTSRANLSIN